MLAVLAAVAAVAYGLHRALLAMERRGWVYYRTKGTGSMGASALFGLNEVFHPQAQSAVVERQERDLRGARSTAAGDPDDVAEDRRDR